MSFRVTRVLRVVAVVVVSAGVLADGGAAQADQVWYQGYQRTSSDEVCTVQPGETPWQAAWGPDASWHPSWEMWANGGRGGWTCGRAITWARDPVASGEAATAIYHLGDIGPGGGIVFYDAGSTQVWGRYLEAAPKAWSASGGDLPTMAWCDDVSSDITGAEGTLIGTGAANTTAMVLGCTSGAGFSAHNYAGGGLNDWFLPSRDELNALCVYSRNPASPPTTCPGVQDSTFAGGAHGFAAATYSSSSQYPDRPTRMLHQSLSTAGSQGAGLKSALLYVRPVRAF